MLTHTSRIFVVAEQQFLRDSLLLLLSTARMRVIGEAPDPQVAYNRVRRLRPDLTICSITGARRSHPAPIIADVDKFKFRQLVKHSKVVVLGPSADRFLTRALADDGIWYVSMESRSDDLISLVRQLTVCTHRGVRSTTGPTEEDEKRLCRSEPNLTSREEAVLDMAARSLTNAQIARRLGIREATVKRHLHNIFKKLGAVSRMDAAHKAGLLSNLRLDDPYCRTGGAHHEGGLAHVQTV